MARAKIEKQLTLEELIPLYGEVNTECNTLKKKVSELNSQIKTEIKRVKRENSDIEINGWKCSLSVSTTYEFDEDRLIEFCKQNKINVVKKKEYVDYDALEKLIYNGKLSEDIISDMDNCRDPKIKETLRCTKLKED